MEYGTGYKLAVYNIIEYIKNNRRLPKEIKQQIHFNRPVNDIYIVFTSPSIFFVYNIPFKKPKIHMVSPTIDLIKDLKKFKIGNIYVVPFIYSGLLIDEYKQYIVFLRFDIFKNRQVFRYLERFEDTVYDPVNRSIKDEKIENKILWDESSKLLKIKTVETKTKIISNSIKIYRN